MSPNRVVAPAALAGVAAVMVALLGAAVAGSGPVGPDATVAATVAALPVPWGAWRIVTELGGGAVVAPVGIVLLVVLLAARRPAQALLIGLALIAMWLGTDALKELFARPRPAGYDPGLASGYAYPSGHALQALTAYGLVALAAWGSASAPWARRGAVAAALLVAGAVGISRVALGVHHPTDVLGGWLGGIAIIASVAALAALVERTGRGYSTRSTR